MAHAFLTWEFLEIAYFLSQHEPTG